MKDSNKLPKINLHKQNKIFPDASHFGTADDREDINVSSNLIQVGSNLIANKSTPKKLSMADHTFNTP